MKLGILMEGGELEFVATIHEAMKRARCYPAYLEIGVAYGETLKGVADGTRDLEPIIVGIELESWEGWNSICDRIKDDENVHAFSGRSTDVIRDHMRIVRFSAALIDACHGKPCVMADFLAVEPLISDGGIVIFHDAGEKEQGIDNQPHCNEPISVRAALTELGLLGDTRPGWRFMKMIPTANQCAVFEKVKTNPKTSDTLIP